MDTAQVPYWDALILAAARRAGSRYLLSEDFQAGRRYEDVEVLNPFEHAPSDFSL
jgi:predicted nucleic acid-binding protein